MTRCHVVFSHGQESGPWGKKISALAEIATGEGYAVASVDYRGIDSPVARVEKLVADCKEFGGQLVLVGSSMGGYVSVAAASLLHARAVFLMAPALYMPGLPALRNPALDCPCEIVHGRYDEVVPLEQSLQFGRDYKAAVHVLDSDHGLHNQVPRIKSLFEFFLIALDMPTPIQFRGPERKP